MSKANKKKWLDELSQQIQQGVEEGHKLTREIGEGLVDGLSKLLPKTKAAPAVWQYKHRVARTAPQLLTAIEPDSREGWELVSVTHDGVNLIAFLKRAKKVEA
jgi:hypothetical protein